MPSRKLNGALPTDGGSCRQSRGIARRLCAWEGFACLLLVVLMPVAATGEEVAVASSGGLQGWDRPRAQGSAPRRAHTRSSGRQGSRTVTAEVSASGMSSEVHIAGHRQSYRSVLFTAGTSRRSGRPERAAREDTKVVPALLPVDFHPESLSIPVGPDRVVLHGDSSPELHRPTGARHVHAGTGAALEGAGRGRERSALVRRAEGNKRLVKGGSSSDISLMRIADGVGTLTYNDAPTTNRRLNRELKRRLISQDVATLVVLLLAFMLTILASCLNIYHFSEDPSPVAYYSDPKMFQPRLLCATAEQDAFLQAFNVQPSTARLRIVGKRRDDQNFGTLMRDAQLRRAGHLIRSRFIRRFSGGGSRRSGPGMALDRPQDAILFDVALDLTPFIAGEGRLSSDADAAALEKHLRGANPLEVLVLCKKVNWAGWEDVATNIRQHLRGLGFQGDVEVRLEAREELLIYRNHPWQNFVRSRITQCIVVLSIVGALFWVPYLWIRSKTVRVESRFEIHLDLDRYWELLAEGLHAQDGFQGTALVH
mmetsp:Transcript_50376/g.155758  ORF Transcript_50376/g.155758 Transcript_50376/m.155758 type:complete len:538 (-) Transcript_50376:106-1719(-)